MTYILVYIRSIIASFILKYVMGWSVNRKYDAYSIYEKDKHVLVYLHTSKFDHLIALLFSYATNLHFITIETTNKIQMLGFKNIFNNFADSVGHSNKSTYESIISDLETRPNFIFAIYPEGSMYRTSGLRSGFYHIAKKCNTDILLLAFDYVGHTIDLKTIVNKNIIATSHYKRKVSEIVIDEMIQTNPYDLTKTFLERSINTNTISNLRKSEENDFDFTTSQIDKFEISCNDIYIKYSTPPNKIDGINISQESLTKEDDQKHLHHTNNRSTLIINLNKSFLRYIPLIILIYFSRFVFYDMICRLHSLSQLFL